MLPMHTIRMRFVMRLASVGGRCGWFGTSGEGSTYSMYQSAINGLQAVCWQERRIDGDYGGERSRS
ncbi:hypothetical protein Pla52n_06400 [Stieleria varia]|uniref:Uncharacterized protein n=1 Tax=Stieleria varia TaxID=2528005 RepID=A0A5C6B9R4_9BACT|nr:hypothetical protein Pla52n_06400 [Stieleria varia]